MKVTQIQLPLPGEHLAATFPVMKPETEGARWRLRVNFWAGRALTGSALELEQSNRAARLAWRGRVATPGVVTGLDAWLELPSAPQAALARAGYFVHVLSGHGLRADGDDAIVPRPLRVPLEQIPVQYVRIAGPGRTPEAAPADATPAAPINAGSFVYNVDTFAAAHEPWAAVLVLCPAEFDTFGKFDPKSPCELDLSQDPFSDERRLDACELRLCELPARWAALPQLADRNSPSFRNRLASVVFGEEIRGSNRQQIRFLKSADGTTHWDTLLRYADVFPWELLGVPIGLLGSEQVSATARAYFLDRASVVRPGGRARARTRPSLRLATDADAAALDPRGTGTPIAWRARVDQFVEQLSLFPARTEADVQALSAHFQSVPPSGFLPRGALALLTTAQAQALPPSPGVAPDRAGVNHFFPAAYDVEAAPVAIEDLDSALASSAALDPYDVSAAAAKDAVRLLVPLPQRVFDPRLLVVEQEDPVFAETLGRFVATRQDWRQRRDFVRTKRDALGAAVDGPQPALSQPALEPGQLEPEPVETVAGLGFTAVLLSPSATTPPWEVSVTFAAPHAVAADTALFLLMRVDAEQPPARVQVRWQTAAGPVSFAWTAPPDPPLERADQTGAPQPTPLFQRFEVTGTQLGMSTGNITGVLLHIDDGQVALAGVGRLVPGNPPGNVTPEFWWRAQDAAPAPQFTGGDWTKIASDQLLAPFEDLYTPSFPDGRSQQARIGDIDTALNPAAITPRAVPMSVATHGIQRMLVELDAEANEADDFVDAHFTRAQTNLYRVRKLILGETAAQRLLINPAIATIADQETATASAEQLGAFLTAAKQRVVTKADVTAALAGDSPRDVGPTFAGGAHGAVTANLFVPEVAPVTMAAKAAGGGRAPAEKTAGGGLQRVQRADVLATVESKYAGQLKDVVGERPESGPTLPPRGLSIGQRFTEPKSTDNLSYARSSLQQVLNQLKYLRLPLVGLTVRSLDQANAVALVDLQGRTIPPAGKTSEDVRQAALATVLTPPKVDQDVDEAQVTLAAMDFIELQSAILRQIEGATSARRAAIDDGNATLDAITAERDLAAGRVLTIEGKLAEARQDVGVARALRQEEQQRVNTTNDQRDALIRDEVKFLAYVRPRTVDPTRREIQYWKLDALGEDQAVPVCLREHDEPPSALNTYLQLMRHAPARWFTALQPLIDRLDTPDKLIALLGAARVSALSFAGFNVAAGLGGAAEAVQFTVLGAQQVVGRLRQRASVIDVGDKRSRRWTDFQRDALQYAAVGDLIDGKHGSREVSAAAAAELDQIGKVATCLHAEFAAAPPTLRLAWVEQFSQFDRPALLRDLTTLPRFGSLDRSARRRMQQLADWLFSRTSGEDDATTLINDLVRLCLLLASHAPVNRIIAGHVPRPTPVRPGVLVPIRPLNPDLVRVGMEFHVWQASRVVAKGHVEDLQQEEVSARIESVDGKTTTIDSSMRVQFVPAALGIMR